MTVDGTMGGGDADLACPACAGPMSVRGGAVLSPWVRARVGATARGSDFLTCRACGTGVFSYRYSQAELDDLYRDYRGEGYFRLRHSWEPSYSAALNDDLGASGEVVEARQAMLVRALDEALDGSGSPIGCVIDIGGDRGQFIPRRFPRRFVMEVSGKPPVDGVSPVTSLQHARAVAPDLLMVCGLLEHLPDPAGFLRSTTSAIGADRSVLVYVEVPAGVPDPYRRRSPELALAIGSAAARTRLTWSLLDRLDARGRVTRGRESALMPLRQSEHINFFTTQGLASMAELLGWDTLLLDEYAMPSRLLEGGRLGFSKVLRGLLRTKVPSSAEVS
jgi:hypothetical protein